MCGILGTSANRMDLAKAAIGELEHRGPDHEGLYSDNIVSFGHRRLSIIDLTDNSNQPIISEDGNYVIVFNGEIYNFVELRDGLKKRGINFISNGDTEVILKGYISEGISFFSRMRGMWAFAMYDKNNSKIILSRDYFGIKPLYYGIDDNNLFFASEIKAIKLMGLGKKINSEHYYQLFNLGYFIAPHTQYADVLKVKPGEILIWDIRNKKIDSDKIHFVDNNNYSHLINEGEAIKALDVSIRDSVSAHFVADTPVGILLSGGNDSSLIAAISKDLGKDPVAYHLSIEGSTDTYYADRIAKHLGISYQSITMSQNALEEQYTKLDSILDEPTGDISIIPTSLIYSLIEDKTKVVLSGEGGDELFGGYQRHAKLLNHDNVYSKSFLNDIFDIFMSGTGKNFVTTINPIMGRIRNKILHGRVVNDSIWAYLQQVKIIDFPIESEKIRNDMYELWSSKEPKSLPSLFFDISMYLPNNLMYKNDISSMASSIEARVPFLDKFFYETTLKIDSKFRLSKDFFSKKILKEVMLKYLPKDLIFRDKKGFGFGFASYNKNIFITDCRESFRFHRDNYEKFGINPSLKKLLSDENCEIILEKYPRFAFALITNWKIMR